jgi:hypothetical protein
MCCDTAQVFDGDIRCDFGERKDRDAREADFQQATDGGADGGLHSTTGVWFVCSIWSDSVLELIDEALDDAAGGRGAPARLLVLDVAVMVCSSAGSSVRQVRRF